MNNISLTVPMDFNALTRASDMLAGMALDLIKDEGKTTALRQPNGQPDYTEAEQQFAESAAPIGDGIQNDTAAIQALADIEPDAAAIFGEGPKSAESAAEPAAGIAPPAEPAASATSADTAPNAATPAGVDLAPSTTTGALIPWDARIHAGSKAKLAKKPNGWKMKRGVSDELVDQVEKELIAAMQASPAKPMVTETEQVAPPPAEEQKIAPPPAATGAVTTFPALMSAITANKIDQAAVTAAVNQAGLQSLPLLAARPDLIPAVAAALGLGG